MTSLSVQALSCVLVVEPTAGPLGVIRLAPTCRQTPEFETMTSTTKNCLFSQAHPWVIPCQMLIGTSISWLMSANWANEFVAEHNTGVEAEEERDGTQ